MCSVLTKNGEDDQNSTSFLGLAVGGAATENTSVRDCRKKVIHLYMARRPATLVVFTVSISPTPPRSFLKEADLPALNWDTFVSNRTYNTLRSSPLADESSG